MSEAAGVIRKAVEKVESWIGWLGDMQVGECEGGQCEVPRGI